MAEAARERWGGADYYEGYMGRWSRRLAVAVLQQLQPATGKRWLDVGCGTGGLSHAIETHYAPGQLLGVDLSEDFVRYAVAHSLRRVAHFAAASAIALPVAPGGYDEVISGLVLNFVPDADVALAQMKEATTPGGRVAVCVWDYAGKMEMLRLFFDAAIAVNAEARPHDEGVRFPICRPDTLHERFLRAGLGNVEVAPVAIEARFVDFDDYWQPFVGGARFPAAAYLMSRSEEEREQIRKELLQRLSFAGDGSCTLTLQAWLAQGIA